jgi:hypothetical protein
MGHYETFVVRLWIKDGGEMENGVVHHLASGTDFRFRRLPQATKFIKELLGLPKSAVVPTDHESVDFEGRSPKG